MFRPITKVTPDQRTISVGGEADLGGRGPGDDMAVCRRKQGPNGPKSSKKGLIHKPSAKKTKRIGDSKKKSVRKSKSLF